MKKNTLLKVYVWLMGLLIMVVGMPTMAQTSLPNNSDTVNITICPNQFPYTFQGNSYDSAGQYTYYTYLDTQRDSIPHYLNLRTYPTVHDTVSLNVCQNDFPYIYSESLTFITSTIYTTSGIHIDSVTGCPTTTTFIVQALNSYDIHDTVEVCEGNIPYYFADSALVETGVYQFHYFTVDSCDSVINLHLMVCPEYHFMDTLNVTTCSFHLPYQFGDSLFSQAGEYDFEIHSRYGCDSVFYHLNLNVVQTQYDTMEFTLCSNEFPFNFGSEYIYDTAGTYFIEHTDENLCHDVTVVLINEIPSYDDTLVVNICDIDTPYTFMDTSFTQSVVYRIENQTVLGCDSNHTLILNVHPTYHLIDTVSLNVCQSEIPFAYGDTILSTTGVYEIDIKTVAGCDSVHETVYFDILENPKDTLTLGICSNDFPYQYYDTVLSEIGTYELLIPDTIGSGCDTLRHLIIESLPIYHDSISVTVCMNEPYPIGDSILTEPGIYDIMLQATSGCDSLITVTLDHYPIYWSDTLSYTICENELPFQYADSSLTTEGVHLVNIPTINGCDSIIPINLHILPIIYNRDTLYQDICANELPIVAFGRTITAAGLYTFTTTSLVTGCDSVFYYRLTVHNNPQPEIMGDNFLCQGTTSNLTLTQEYNSYLWNNGSTYQMVNISQPNLYSVTVTNEFGCQARAEINVISAALPDIQITGNQTICKGQSTTLTAAGGVQYVWEDGRTAASIVVQPTVTTTYHVTVSSATPCSRQGNITVYVNELPTPTISGASSVCRGDSTEYIVTGGTSYVWSNGVTSDRIIVHNSGTYTVTATDNNGCRNSISKVLTIDERPNIHINGRTQFCFGQSTTLTAVGAVSYEWSSAEMVATINVTLPGQYFVTGTAANGCTSTANTTVTVQQVSATIVGNRSFCSGESTTLTVNSSENYSYHWTDGSSTASIEVFTPGTYTVTITSALGCSTPISTIVTENQLPNASITGRTTICEGEQALLRASGGVSYLWDNGSTQAYLSVTTTGTYAVTVTDTRGCSASTTETVIVNPKPNITILADNHICRGNSTSLYAISAPGNTYAWISGQNTPLIEVTPLTTTMYTVMVTDANGCTNQSSTTINVNNIPTPSINGVTSICQGESTSLTVTGGNNYQYSWSNGANTNTIVISPQSTSQYSVTVTDAYGCQGSAVATVTIGSMPNVGIMGETQICEGQTTQLSVPVGYSYRWSNNSIASSITTSVAGQYSVTITNNMGCSTSDTVHVIVNELPPLSFGMHHSICAGQSYTYTLPEIENIIYTWSNHAVGNTITVQNTGVYTVTATNQYGCQRSASDSLSVHPIPTPVISGETSICRGSSTILTATGGDSYQWSNGATTSDIAVFPNNQTTYSVTATNAYGCSASTSTTVIVKVLPSITFNGETAFCEGTSTTITAVGGVSYSWSTNSSSNSIHIAEPGTYYVTVMNSAGCQRIDSIAITTYATPTIDILGNTSICEGASEILSATGAISYQWSTGENGSSIAIVPTNTTTYTVTGTDINGCSAIAVKTIHVEALPNVQISGVFEICQGDTTTLLATGGATYLWNNGSTSASIRAYGSGNYTVIATSPLGCTNSQTQSVVVHSKPVVSIIGPSVLCSNETCVLHATGGDFYQWNNGVQTDSVRIYSGGTYSVTVTNQHQCSTAATTNVATLNAPYVQIVGAEHICEGSFTTLVASSNAQNYHWSTNEISPNITVSPTETTTYIVTASNTNGCISKDSLTMVVNPTYNINMSASICQGTPYIQNGFNLPTQTEAGIFTHTNYLQSVNGCDSTVTLLLTVKPLPIMPDTISGNTRIGNYGSYLYSVSDAQNVNSYEWRITNTHWTLTDNHINSAFLQVSQNGNGTLIARGINDCGYDEVSLNIYCNVDVDEYTNDTQILLYPNPTAQYLNINFKDAVVSVAKVQLYDNLGRCLQTIPVDGTQLQIECNSFAAGTYFVKFTNENGKVMDTRKVVIK